LPSLALLILAPLLRTEVEPGARLAVALVAAVTALTLLHPRVPAAASSGLWLALAALPLLVVGTWLGADAGAARSRLVDLGLFVIAFRAGRHVLGLAGGRWLLGSLAVVGGLTGLRGLLQHWVTFPQALEALESSEAADAGLIALRVGTGRVFSTFLLPSAFAGFLILSLPVTVFLALKGGLGHRWRWAAWASAAAQLAALYLTYSHGAFLSLALALTLMALLAAGGAVRGTALATAGMALILLVAVLVARGESLTGEASPLTERLGNWKVAAGQMADHPVAGVGWGAYGAAYTRYQEQGMNQSRYAHNTYLQLPAEGGVLVLPFLALFVIWFFRQLRRRQSTAPGVLLGLTAVLLHNLLDFTLLLPGIGIPFFLLLGHLAAGQTRAKAPRMSSNVAALLLAVAVASLVVPETMARRSFARAVEHQQQGRAVEAGALVERAIRLDPWTAHYRDFHARWLLSQAAGDPGVLMSARRLALDAVRLAPATPVHHATLEAVCLAQGDAGCAFREAARAAALFPASEDYRRNLRRYLTDGQGMP
jgi:O-antigen ligase